MLADALLPFVAILPAAQIVLFVITVIIEGVIIRKFTGLALLRKNLWLSVAGANLVTLLIGVVLACPLMWLQLGQIRLWLPRFHLGRQNMGHSALVWFSHIFYGFLVPFALIISCYVISWRTEFALLARWLSVQREDRDSLRSRTILAHRVTYSILAIPIILACLSYGIMLSQGL